MSAAERSPTLPGKEVDVTYGEHKLRLFLDMGVGIGGDKWPAADSFCNMVTQTQWYNFFGGLFDGKRVLELGSGNAVAGILLEKAYKPKEVCITDLESHIPHINRNIATNACSGITNGIPYDWTAAPATLHPRLENGSFDVILALECVYREDLYLPLILAIKKQSHAGTVCFLGSTRQFTKPSFFRLLTDNGLAYKKLPSTMLPSELRDESIGMFVVHFL